MTVLRHLFPFFQSLQSTSPSTSYYSRDRKLDVVPFPLTLGQLFIVKLKMIGSSLSRRSSRRRSSRNRPETRSCGNTTSAFRPSNNWLHCRILSVCRWFFPLLREVFSGYYSFPRSSKTNIFKFQFDHWQQSGRRRTGATWMCYILIVIDFLTSLSSEPFCFGFL